MFSQSPSKVNSSSSQSTLSYHSTQQSGNESEDHDIEPGNDIQKDDADKG